MLGDLIQYMTQACSSYRGLMKFRQDKPHGAVALCCAVDSSYLHLPELSYFIERWLYVFTCKSRFCRVYSCVYKALFCCCMRKVVQMNLKNRLSVVVNGSVNSAFRRYQKSHTSLVFLYYLLDYVTKDCMNVTHLTVCDT